MHTPLQAKPGLEKKYVSKGGVDCQQHAVYAGMVDNMDSCIGSLVEELDRLGIEPAAIIPEDENIYQYDLEMKPLLDLPDSPKAVIAVDDLMVKVLDKTTVTT